ncbi:MAG: pyridoxal-dependent decarboxylase [Nannocystaceae bacterium]
MTLEVPDPDRFRWSADAIREVGYRFVDLIADHLTSLPDRPVFTPYPPALRDELLAAPLPEDGVDAATLLEELARFVEPYPFGNGHPRFYGWVNPPPAVIGVFAEALASAMNPSVAGGNHAAVHLETLVVRWLAELLGFPAGTGGLLVSGGSMATLTGLAVARTVALGPEVRAEGLVGDPGRTRGRPRIYVGVEAHSCVRKSAELLGLGHDALRVIPSDADRRIDVDALRSAIAADRRAGDHPLAVVASAGTVNTGAIDPLEAIADLCAAEHLWMHVDAAYGGPAILSARYRAELAPIARADSIAVDPHKWLYVPVEAGLCLCRDPAAMRATFSHVPAYLRTDGDPDGVGGPMWRSEIGFQQTRGFRALKIWACLRFHGLRGYTLAIEHDIALAARLAAAVAQAPELELAAKPGLSVVCFRLRGDVDGGRTRAALRRLQIGGEAFVAGTEIDGRAAMRACVVNPRAREEDIDRLVAAVRSIARDLG